MRVTRFAVMIGVFASTIVLAACGGSDETTATSGDTGDSGSGGEPLVIGMTIEKTGALSVLGPATIGAEKAVDYLNEQGGVNGQQVELIVQDNASESGRAIQNINDLVANDADIIIGPLFIQDCFAIEGTVAKSQVPEICGSPSDLKQAAPSFQFGVGPATSQMDQAVYSYFADLGLKKIGTLAATDQSGEQAQEWAEEYGEEENGLEVEVELSNPAATTIKPQLQKLIANGAEAIYATSCGGVSITAASDAVALNFDGPFLLINCFASEEVAKQIKGFVNGNVLTMAPEFMLGPPYSDLRKEANELYNEEVGINEITVADGWDMVLLAAKAVEEAGSTDPGALNETLENDFEFIGAFAGGTFTPEDHRGQLAEGIFEPAVFTKQGTLERAK